MAADDICTILITGIFLAQIHVSRIEPVGGTGRAEDDSREAEENKKNELQDRLHKQE